MTAPPASQTDEVADATVDLATDAAAATTSAASRRAIGGVARGGVAGILGAGVAGLAGLAVTWLVAHRLGPEHAGAFFAATAAFVLTSTLAKLGTQTGLVYWPARLRARGHGFLLGACLRSALTPVVCAALVVGVVLFVAAPELARLTAGEAPPAVHAELVMQLHLLSAFVPLAVLSDTLLAATRGYRLIRPTVLLDKLVRPGLQTVGVTAVALSGAAGPSLFALAWALPYLPTALLAAYALHRAHTQTMADIVPTRVKRSHRASMRKAFWRFTGPRSVASVAQLALQRVDVLLVAALAGLGAAGLYAVAGRFVVLGQFANQGITQAVQPRLAEALAVKDRTAANTLYQTATGWLMLLTWPLYLLVLTYAPAYLGIFGPAFREGASIVAVLALAMLVATGCGMVDIVLSMAGRTSWNLGNVLVALGLTIALDLALIPRLGALGAAIGLASAVVANNMLPLAQVGLGLRLHPFGAGWVSAAAVTLLSFGAAPRAVGFVLGNGPFATVVALGVAAVTYLVGLRLLRGPLALDALKALRPGRRR
ncbi:polysaccharide biosynthesis C-terminal domain-containing protein [Asanoa sp. NPDC050611]|uniref:lipopolysaccharide biosynthesis protein n=1 Tax=Asanoa sp. NPDC050611 TaxID=3157098 RepID=UPI003410A0ED